MLKKVNRWVMGAYGLLHKHCEGIFLEFLSGCLCATIGVVFTAVVMSALCPEFSNFVFVFIRVWVDVLILSNFYLLMFLFICHPLIWEGWFFYLKSSCLRSFCR